MSTNNQVGVSLSGQVGTGSFVGSVNGAVLLTPGGDQYITADNLLLDNGSVFALSGAFISGNIGAGGYAGIFKAVSDTVNKGSISFTCADNAGNFNSSLTNASTSAARTWTLPDGTGNILVDGSYTNALSNFTGMTVTKSNGTEVSNAVTTSGYSGVITTSNLSNQFLYSITWTNSVITPSSVILLQWIGGTGGDPNPVFKVVPTVGTAELDLYTTSSITGLSGTFLIGYLII